MTTLIQLLSLYQLYVQLLKRKITFSEETSGASDSSSEKMPGSEENGYFSPLFRKK